MFFFIYALDKKDSGHIRRTNKSAHKAHLDAGAPSLRVLQSGPIAAADGSECGSLIVVEAESRSSVEAYLERDPYTRAGLFATAQIHSWLWRRGNPYICEGGVG